MTEEQLREMIFNIFEQELENEFYCRSCDQDRKRSFDTLNDFFMFINSSVKRIAKELNTPQKLIDQQERAKKKQAHYNGLGEYLERKIAKETKQKQGICKGCEHEKLHFNEEPCVSCAKELEPIPEKWEPKEPEPELDKNCDNCKYLETSALLEPCASCNGFKHFKQWKPIPEKEPKEPEPPKEPEVVLCTSTKEPESKTCFSCKYEHQGINTPPCDNCNFDKWKPKEPEPEKSCCTCKYEKLDLRYDSPCVDCDFDNKWEPKEKNCCTCKYEELDLEYDSPCIDCDEGNNKWEPK